MQANQQTTSSAPALSTDDAKKIVAWVKQQYGNIKSQRTVIERQWYYNMAFYFGRQYVAFRSTGNSVVGPGSGLYTPYAPPWRSRPVINRVRPIIRKEMTKLLSQKPTAFIVPASSEDEDVFAAQAGEQIWETIYHEKKVRQELRKAVWWNSICGSGFLKCYWDDTKLDESNQVMGDVCIDNITPFHLMIPDFREEEIEKQPFVIQAQLKNIEAVQIAYPDLNVGGSKSSPNEIIDSTWMNLAGVGTKDGETDLVLMLEAWIKPNQLKMFPDGAMVTIVGEQIAQVNMGWPYEHAMYPFAKIDHVPSGKLYGDSVISDLISLQKEFNRRRGQIQEAANRMAKPQWVAEKGSVDATKMTSEPGQVILYSPGFNEPHPVPPVNLPPYLFEELDLIKADMNDISAQHEISKGQVPPNVEAATAISFLQEQDDSMLASAYESVEEAMEKVAKLVLNYVKQYWDFERTVRVTGIDGSFDVMAFKGSQVGDNTDIRIEAGSSLPTSRAGRQAFLMDLLKLGAPNLDPNMLLELMQIGGVEKLYEHVKVDVRQAQRENIRMAAATPEIMQQFMEGQQQDAALHPEKYMDPETGATRGMSSPEGEPRPPLIVPVNNFDNHQTHIRVHNDYRKGQQFENTSDDVKQLFDLHVMMHTEQLGIFNMATATVGFKPNEEIPSDQAGGGAPAPMPPGPEPGPEGEMPQ
jgi:hypothetical protein